MTATVPGRPILRYPGGKWRLAAWVVRHLPKHRVYCEPFCGAASVLMQMPRAQSETINDLDSDVVNLLRVLRDPVQGKELERQLRLTPFSREEYSDAFELSEEPIERARRLVVRSFQGYGSAACRRVRRTGFRMDIKRHGCTPGMDWASYPDYLAGMTQRLAGVCIEHCSAMELIPRYNLPDCCLFVDPPYVRSARKHADRMYEHEMTDAQHEELAELLHATSSMVVLAGYRSELYDRLYAGWRTVERTAYQDNRVQGGTKPLAEVLWFNPAATQGLQTALTLEQEVQG